MPRLLNAARSAGTHAHAVLCLLVMLTFIRACIPAGFMPDPAALAQGRLALILCPAAGGAPLWPNGISGPGTGQTAATTHMSGNHASEGHDHDYANAVAESRGEAHRGSVFGGDHSEHLVHIGKISDGDTATHIAHDTGGALSSPSPNPHAGHSEAAALPDCPFSLIAHLTIDLPTPAAALALPVRLASGAPATVPQARPPLPPAGPPLGSRAPPDFQA